LGCANRSSEELILNITAGGIGDKIMEPSHATLNITQQFQRKLTRKMK
jgi:hypothetical protein